ncbi:type VII toxin-antitoxin system MntA family adenylyltransferase antitoxin [Paenibacillus antibioticophila]|uniref:Nucleotidyltransferase n=1 Tax=Paenibacillus antibioticophila TaxID=1274374 RepID=A0A919XSM2_9BACL|nr:nucleotidyltransferase family protein [Paenibacillus antibioticophila]GIO36818.1 nucleotidyltransferase [Paenibacillus antibioticophila]
MSIQSLIKSNHSLILSIAKSNGAKKISLFGSAARGEEREDSDIDFLVEFEEDKSLFDLIRLKNELEDLLNRPVDIVTENSIHWKMKDNILSEAIQL